ncbi:MAG: basic amino acid ABC transporter substrate-binding protein [Spirochaetales bacterium]|nr:basic amino acid ABC transporter substrate-binding protein [Spirochaetales bacterium]
MKKFILTICVATIAFSCSKMDRDKYLYMGTNAEFPPFEYVGGESGTEVIGFDVEIAREIAKDLGKELKIENMKFDGLLPALKAGKIDLAIAGMTITEERKKNVDFSSPYYEATQAVIVVNTSIKTKEDLTGKKIGVQLGTSGEIAAKTISNNVVAFNSGLEAIMELKTGRIDAVIIDIQPAKFFLAKNPELFQAPIDFEAEFYGIAIKKGNEELLKSINKTIERLFADGKYNNLVEEFMK